MAAVVSDRDTDGLPDAFGSTLLPLLPALVARNEGGAGDAGRGEWHARNDDEERTPAGAHIGAQPVEERGGGQQACVPDDQGAGAVAQGEGKCATQFLRVMDPGTEEVRQMDTERSSARRIETVVRIEEQDGVGPGNSGEESVQERGDTRTFGACDEMRVPKGQAIEERVERG